jgi:hypothetical protein
MRYLVLLMFVVFLPENIHAQQVDCNCSSDEEFQLTLLNGLIGIEYNNPVAGYEGEQFLQDWAYGEIKLRTGEVIKNVILRYDRFMDQLLWLRMKDYRKGILNKKEISEFRLYRQDPYPEALFVKKRIRLPYLDSTDIFVQELVRGKIELFAYRNVKKEPVHSRLFDDTRHIISTPRHDYLIRLRRKNLLDMPFIIEAEMKKILRHNHITIRDNEQGLAMALMFYNQLEL